MSLIEGLRHAIHRAHGHDPRSCDGCADAERLLAAIEGAEVMWRVHRPSQGWLSMFRDKRDATMVVEGLRQRGEKIGDVERVLVIREEES